MPELMDVALGVLIVMVVAGSLFAVLLKKVFYNLLGFGLAMIGISGITLILGSEFVALMQMLIFVGGITIAMVFAVMMSTPKEQLEEARPPSRVIPAVVVTCGFTGVLAWAMVSHSWNQLERVGTGLGSVKELGLLLLTDYELSFEAISLVLLAAIIGAILIARRTREAEVDGG